MLLLLTSAVPQLFSYTLQAVHQYPQSHLRLTL
jgi:hypothetical protein